MIHLKLVLLSGNLNGALTMLVNDSVHHKLVFPGSLSVLVGLSYIHTDSWCCYLAVIALFSHDTS